MDGATLLLVRGILGVIMGFVAFAWPGITIAALVAIFGIFAFIDGITNLVLGFTPPQGQNRSWAHLLQGIAGIVAGVLTFIWPIVTALVLVIFIGSWAIVTGALEIAAAIRLRKVISGEWMLALSGILSVLFGIVLFLFPAAGAVGIAWILGVYTAAAGFVLIALGIRLRSGLRAVTV